MVLARQRVFRTRCLRLRRQHRRSQTRRFLLQGEGGEIFDGEPCKPVPKLSLCFWIEFVLGHHLLFGVRIVCFELRVAAGELLCAERLPCGKVKSIMMLPTNVSRSLVQNLSDHETSLRCCCAGTERVLEFACQKVLDSQFTSCGRDLFWPKLGGIKYSVVFIGDTDWGVNSWRSSLTSRLQPHYSLFTTDERSCATIFISE